MGPLQMAPRGPEFTSGVKVRLLSFGGTWVPTSVEHTKCAVPRWANYEVKIDIRCHCSHGSLQRAARASLLQEGPVGVGQSGGLPLPPTTTPTLTDLGTQTKLGSCWTCLFPVTFWDNMEEVDFSKTLSSPTLKVLPFLAMPLPAACLGVQLNSPMYEVKCLATQLR